MTTTTGPNFILRAWRQNGQNLQGDTLWMG